MLYKKTNCYELYQGKMEEELSALKDNSVDSIITDPPYELNFMNKGWDNAGVSFQKETWEKCLRVLKPGGYLLAFGGSRTFHRIACAIEDAGFEIRDTIMWLYGSGFPKSMNIGLMIDKKNGVESAIGEIKPGHSEFVNRSTNGHMQFDGGMDGFDRPWMHDAEKRELYHYQKMPTSSEAKLWDGWGTCLKPSYEPIIVARKPFKGSLVDNVIEYGVGGINIDECRIGTDDMLKKGGSLRPNSGDTRNGKSLGMFQEGTENTFVQNEKGRFPANTILTYDDADFDEVCGGFPYTKSTGGSGEKSMSGGLSGKVYNGGWSHDIVASHLGGLGDSGSASRYFYCAKASKKDRNEGLNEFNKDTTDDGRNKPIDNPYLRGKTMRHNIHPTVKPTDLMQYLVRLVSPKGAVILDPFMGSGSTGKAVMFENRERNANYRFIGIEMTEDYLPICEARINYAMNYVYGDDDYDISKQPTETTQNKKKLW